MTSQPPFSRRSFNSKHARRTIAVLLATLLLHLIVGGWGRKQIGWPANTTEPSVITVSLQAPPAAEPKPQPVPAKPAPKPRQKPRPKLPSPPLAMPKAPLPLIAGEQGNWQIDNPVAATNANADNASMETDATPPEPPASPPHRIDAPPSVALKYDVQGLREGNKVYGSGKIIWRNQDGRYHIDGDASVLFFTLLQFSSEGILDDFGVSPTRYTEKRFRKTATDTRFDHERNTITFSSSDQHYPRPGDAQDRASIIWQLAAIGRGDPSAFFSGAHFALFVAGVHDAEPWQITVAGEENADIGGDPTPAWHLVRLPQPGSYDQKIDIWLAPQQQWYPVKIRYTESNGEFLEMSLSRQTPLQPN